MSPFRALARTYWTTAASRPSPTCPMVVMLPRDAAIRQNDHRSSGTRCFSFMTYGPPWSLRTTSSVIGRLGTAATPRGIDLGNLARRRPVGCAARRWSGWFRAQSPTRGPRTTIRGSGGARIRTVSTRLVTVCVPGSARGQTRSGPARPADRRAVRAAPRRSRLPGARSVCHVVTGHLSCRTTIDTVGCNRSVSAITAARYGSFGSCSGRGVVGEFVEQLLPDRLVGVHVVQRPRQRGRRGLVTGDQQRPQLLAHLVVAAPGAVVVGHQDAQHVIEAVGAGVSAVRNLFRQHDIQLDATAPRSVATAPARTARDATRGRT